MVEAQLTYHIFFLKKKEKGGIKKDRHVNLEVAIYLVFYVVFCFLSLTLAAYSGWVCQ